MTGEVRKDNGVLANVLPDNGEVPDELERLTMGYEDYSEDSLATKLFEGMTQRQRNAVHRFAMNGPRLTLQHLKDVTDLVDGYHARDPERKAAQAMEEVLAEVDSHRAYFETVNSNEFMPALVMVRPVEVTGDSADKPVWGVRSTKGEEEAIVKKTLPDFDLVETFVRAPEASQHDWDNSFFTLIGRVNLIIDPSSLTGSAETE